MLYTVREIADYHAENHLDWYRPGRDGLVSSGRGPILEPGPIPSFRPAGGPGSLLCRLPQPTTRYGRTGARYHGRRANQRRGRGMGKGFTQTSGPGHASGGDAPAG